MKIRRKTEFTCVCKRACKGIYLTRSDATSLFKAFLKISANILRQPAPSARVTRKTCRRNSCRRRKYRPKRLRHENKRIVTCRGLFCQQNKLAATRHLVITKNLQRLFLTIKVFSTRKAVDMQYVLPLNLFDGFKFKDTRLEFCLPLLFQMFLYCFHKFLSI